ncbi:MAG: hypothetical protein R3D44_11160 [Hyphomicrobiaceae bacterium]
MGEELGPGHGLQSLELKPLAPPEPAHVGSRRSVLARWVRERRGYMLFVILPSLLSVVYFAAIAADRYETEARFVVRSPSMAATSQLANLVQGSAIVRSSDDAYVVHAYMESRDAVRKLAQTMDLGAVLKKANWDVAWWFPGPFYPRTEEGRWRHFQRFLTLKYDTTTGISTLRVQAFSPEDAQAIARNLLANSEALINRLSNRATREAINTAQKEVERNRQLARASVARVTEFRRRNALIDPGRVSQEALKTISELAVLIARTNAELLELQRASPNSPQAASLKLRITATENQIKKEREALAGADTSLAPLLAEYEGLVLEREFAEKSFASAQSALDLARVEGERQRLFLEQISAPSLPDFAVYPYRIVGIIVVFVALHLLFNIFSRLLRDTRSHAGR